MATVDWIIVAGYLVIALAVGIYFARRAGGSTNEFFISGRNLPWWLAGTSMVATSFAADTPLVITGWVRKSGISHNWLWWSFAIGGMFSVFFLSRLWRRAEVVTDVELAELRYGGKPAAALRAFRGAYMAVFVNCIVLAWVIVAMNKLMGVLLDIDPVVSTAICLVLTVVYAAMSGFWGVVVTDLLQFVLAMIGSIVLCVLAVNQCGGLDQTVARATQISPLGDGLVNFFPRPPAGTGPFDEAFWSGPIFAIAIFLCVQWWANKNADGGGVVVQRMLASKDERHSLLATLWFNIANYALRPWPWILVALCSAVLIPDVALLPGKDHEMAYPMMMKNLAPPGLLGLMVAAFLGAFMSTIDTHLNLSSAYIVNDVYRRFLRKDATEKHYVLVSRIASVCFMLIGGGIALVFNSISGLFTFLLSFTAGIGLVLILRWFWWRVNAWSEMSAMITSAVVASTLYVMKKYAFPQELAWMTTQWVLAITVAVSTVVWLTVTFVTEPVDRKTLAKFYSRVRPFGAWGQAARDAGIPRPRGLGRMLGNWIAGSVMVLAATMAIGKFLLGEHAQGAIYLAATIAGAAVVAVELRRINRDPTAG